MSENEEATAFNDALFTIINLLCDKFPNSDTRPQTGMLLTNAISSNSDLSKSVSSTVLPLTTMDETLKVGLPRWDRSQLHKPVPISVSFCRQESLSGRT